MVEKHEAGALILRLTLGVIFFFHGLAKFQGGIENTNTMFADLGLTGFLAYVVAFTELIGGVALVLGLGTRFLSLLLAVIMTVAIIKVKFTNGLLGTGQAAGFELDLTLLAMSIYLMINGSTLFSVDQILSKNSNQQKAVV
ncbi:DoxX family protein [Halobacillus amylolyticus]|uniref:DoxX family protein n=1 Tax=Halobacillus amylolyticus TaxID=2932259 RepID=A0ABY4H6P0_9BACI|nr:DoxX family protein [Halobacillus amylolyticus]UOR10536.1 DoxX family protein [Halobacillus amylolyticus]